MLKALIFDFDGLILDTETPEFDVLQEIYAEYDAELSIAKWGQVIGGNGETHFDPLLDLEKSIGVKIDRAKLENRWRKEANERSFLPPSCPVFSRFSMKPNIVLLNWL